MKNIIDKYENEVIKSLDVSNMKRIVSFLKKQNCDYIDELLSDYLDLFTIPYNEFVNKFNDIDVKYNFNFIEEVRSNMDLLEEFYMI